MGIVDELTAQNPWGSKTEYEPEDEARLREKMAAQFPKHKIRLFRVTAMADVTICAADSLKALNAAIDTAPKNRFVRADCNIIAVLQEEEDEDNVNP